jgi:hypothetical protein
MIVARPVVSAMCSMKSIISGVRPASRKTGSTHTCIAGDFYSLMVWKRQLLGSVFAEKPLAVRRPIGVDRARDRGDWLGLE